jgi:hypothetical protein
MGLLYAVALDNATAVTSVAAGEDLVTTTSGEDRSLSIREFQFSGLGTRSRSTG